LYALHELRVGTVCEAADQQVHLLDLQLVHLHVPQVPQHALEAQDVLLRLAKLVLCREEVQDGADVRGGPGVITFGDLGPDQGVECVHTQAGGRIDQLVEFHIPCLILQQKFDAAE